MIKPMLAYKVDKKPVDWSEKVYIQPKLDGVRCVISKDGAWSRTGKPWLNIDHILENLKPFFKQHPDIILDGELYNHELKNDFENLSGSHSRTSLHDHVFAIYTCMTMSPTKLQPITAAMVSQGTP